MRRALGLLTVLTLACSTAPGGDLAPATDAGTLDAAAADATSTDATSTDATSTDATSTDATSADAQPTDATPADAGEVRDAGQVRDAAAADAAERPDATPVDASTASDAGLPDAASDPAEPGPAAVSVERATIERAGRTIPVAAHVPAVAGPAPLVVFLPGFRLDSSRYSALADHVASHGFVFVRADPPAPFVGLDHTAMAADASAVIDWALDPNGPLAGRVDAARVGVAGHSLGGKVATMTAFADRRVRALFALDPVNGGSPLSGYSTALPDVVPDQVAPLAIPVGFAGETVNGAGGLGGQACAPLDQNFETFYDAATSAPWAAEWTIDGADHMDFLDDAAGCGLTCAACPDGTADEAAVRRAVHTLAAAFVRRHLRGEITMEHHLTGGGVPSGVTSAHRP